MSVEPVHKADVYAEHLPGIVIFVHGVNSDGEWYDAAEEGLIAGLNKRLGLDQARVGATLEKVTYRRELFPNGSMNRTLDGKTFISSSGCSPVIRFRWGYKAAGKDETYKTEDEAAAYKTKIYLNSEDAWGGGPFQNGTTALSYMWGNGLDDRVFWWLYLNMFAVEGRDIYACPPRTYFAHAAHRLKELIKAIRDKQADCPITVVCHSQGNMITLAAALLGRKESALADTYVLCNPPYSLESIPLEQMDPLGSTDKTSFGQFGSVTTKARQETFVRFLAAVEERAASSQTLELINGYLGFVHPGTKQSVFKLAEFPSEAERKKTPATGVDRDNRGRVFLYCNPHDQVIGVKPVQGIGWRGISNPQLDELQSFGGTRNLHQRVWATPGGNQSPLFRVGSPEWSGVPYRYLEHNHTPKQFWDPAPPAMRFTLSSLEPDPTRGRLSWIATVMFAPVIYIVTHVLNLRINGNPPKDWSVTISAPALSEPVEPSSKRYGKIGRFDEQKDAAVDALAPAGSSENANDDRYGGAYRRGGQGDADTEASLRYEHAARLELERARAAQRRRPHTEEDDRAAIERMLKEHPNATDHSTILTNPAHAQGVLAYDVAIGWVNPSKITATDMSTFRQFAHWMYMETANDRLPVIDDFMEYWRRGFYEEHPVQFFYDMVHMNSQAPDIQDEREQSLFGRTRG